MPKPIHILVAVSVCVVLSALACLAPAYPCGYYGADEEYAGYGYQSLAKVTSEGFGWGADSVPVPYERYSGTDPYEVKAGLWTAALYVPIFVAIIFLSFLIYSGRLTRPSRTSAEHPEQIPKSRKHL